MSSSSLVLSREIPVFRRGKLDVSTQPPCLWWDGEQRQGFRQATIKLLAALMAEPVVDADELLDTMGWDTINTLRTKMGETRAMLRIAAIPVQIISIKKQNGRGISGFRVEVDE